MERGKKKTAKRKKNELEKKTLSISLLDDADDDDEKHKTSPRAKKLKKLPLFFPFVVPFRQQDHATQTLVGLFLQLSVSEGRGGLGFRGGGREES